MMIFLTVIFIVILYILVGWIIYKFTKSTFEPVVIWWLPLIIIMALVRAGIVSFGCISGTRKITMATA